MSYAVASLIRRFRQEPLSTALIDAHAGGGGSLGSAALSLADGLHVVPEFPLLLKRFYVCSMSWNAWRAWTAYLHRYRERSQTSIAGATLRSRFFRQLNEKCDLSSFESEFDPEVRDELAHEEKGPDAPFSVLYWTLGDQACSHGLRPESRADLCITPSATTTVRSEPSRLH
ncbi:hypothetical protein ACDH60_25985 [Pseudomonas ficuserectae]|uniref:Uncharacterized protein n=2 Tax=Pseudomonas amygdali pv. lachrymans TaxID=53707 RepID=A0AB37R092_PSEAV|nr:hypothetical protein [Pseudomonas amygdali]ARA79367.1 hypothetical protein B5U27_04365 [Pseudomonas amygdali pv. lachrymans]AXH57983.1 hypothetical protein PLA107_023995 [Pseudomonas amygdali pv. lachrymans str. M301315]KKY57726.1 hypothetical protein AAY85_14605 [Pseudomonas amygdali pv. lachrymans]PWD02222.1 hypothetical protein CX658_07100 [Pseudomonas amygdali pv. lachrymans]RMM37258.1 hypothetical protein ALQ79_101792 [Pseudomonas amygdali pv. lachrymans]